jgi:hypothetical protein
MKSLLCVILHGSMHADRYENVMTTWGQNVPCLFYSDHDDAEKSIIKVSERTDYHSNEDKFVNVFQHIPEDKQTFDWYLFCDNDTFVNTSLLQATLEEFDEEKIYGQEIFTWPNDPSLGYPSGGGGILMSQKRLKHAIEHFHTYNVGYSDVSFGIYLREFNIELVNDKRFRSQPPEHYFIKIGDAPTYFTFHYITDLASMIKLYNRCRG